MNAATRIAIWFFGAFASALPIYIVVASSLEQLGNLFSAPGYAVASKAIFLFYFSISIVAFFNLLESLIASNVSKFWRRITGLFLGLIFCQILITSLFYRDIYFGYSSLPTSFEFKVFVWAILQSFLARLVFLIPANADV
jgi:uncharacterized membrane protein required for colicin V production